MVTCKQVLRCSTCWLKCQGNDSGPVNQTLGIKEKGESFHGKANFSDSQSPICKYTFILPPKKIKWNKVNCLSEEEGRAHKDGWGSSPQNRAWSQPLLRRQGPGEPFRLSALFLFPRPESGGSQDGQLYPCAAICDEKPRVEGAGTAGQLAPRPKQNWVTLPGQAVLLLGASASSILKRGRWPPRPPGPLGPALHSRVGTWRGCQPSADPWPRCARGGTGRGATLAPSCGAAGVAGEARGDAGEAELTWSAAPGTGVRRAASEGVRPGQRCSALAPARGRTAPLPPAPPPPPESTWSPPEAGKGKPRPAAVRAPVPRRRAFGPSPSATLKLYRPSLASSSKWNPCPRFSLLLNLH